MDTNRIFKYLKGIAAHNSREWFLDNKAEYLAVREDFEEGVDKMLRRLTLFDADISPLNVRDVVYRFNRDTRFSPDKSPYKRHFGAYFNSHGKKSMHGGYYIHLEPGHCMVCLGTYYLPTNILTSTRNEIISNSERWLDAVENSQFLNLFGHPCSGNFEDSQRGFGIGMLKTCPTGFDRTSPLIDYLRMKDYCCWVRVDDDFFGKQDFPDRVVDILSVGRSMNDFINAVVDDYL